ncbi:MAG TPA: competence protein CoiA family protein [Chthonomonadaceae bacterium]|nr:competence protein CoiA family protein [Chthonomonadaceae bacterium]
MSGSASNRQNLLSACHGERRVTIGRETPEELRRLSDARALTCPGCGAPVVLHAGTVRAHHFAHLPGAVCTLPQTEPETEEHRAGKLLIARWLRERLPEAEIVVEATIPETNQRADVLAILSTGGRKPRRVALEYQCADLSAREWRRRHRLYREAGIEDLWLLGGSRLIRETPSAEKKRGNASVVLRTAELERALLWDGAPLLFLDAVGERLPAETLARFRPDPESQALRPSGRLPGKPLLALDFPWPLLSWPDAAHPNAPTFHSSSPVPNPQSPVRAFSSEAWLWEWLVQRFRVSEETLTPFFGLPVFGQEAFACQPRLWQAAIYYRFVHRRVGDSWWLAEIETWTRTYLPLARPTNLRQLRGALAEFQEILAAAGFLSLPMGYGRVNARITADLTTLPQPPDVQEVLRLARYRRTLAREARSDYLTGP